jgi:large subunit ribosomal protein L20
MVRVKTNVATRRRKKRVLKAAKGQFLQRSKRYQQAARSLINSRVYSYRDRKVRKGDFRRIWIIRLNAACREAGINYSRFIKGLHNAKVTMDRKTLADLAVNSTEAFHKLVEIAKKA